MPEYDSATPLSGSGRTTAEQDFFPLSPEYLRTVAGGLRVQEALMIAKRLARISLQSESTGVVRRAYSCMRYYPVGRWHSTLGSNSGHSIPCRTVRLHLAFGIKAASSRRGEEFAGELDRAGGAGTSL